MLLTMTVAASLPSGPPATAAAPDPEPALQTITLGRQETHPFSLLGITWDDPRATLDGPVHVRTRKIGAATWTPWQSLEADGTAAADRRGATDPLWVGASDAI